MEEQNNKYLEAINASQVVTDDSKIATKVEKIINEHLEENKNADVYNFLLNTIDLTTLSPEDSEKSVGEFVQRVNDFETNYPMLKNVAAICVY